MGKSVVQFLIIFSIFFYSNILTVYSQDNGYLAFADEMPKPIGGLEEIYKDIEYPAIAKQAGIEGKVYVLAFINEKGNVDDVKIVKGIGAGCDKAAINAVKKAKFEPGKTGGKVAKVKMSLQIQFKLKWN